MSEGPDKRVVVVLGSGRSGTSLTMNVAAHLGVKLSPHLVGPSGANPKGAFEDVDILRESRAILRHFHRNGASLSYLPLPDDWMQSAFVRETGQRLKSILAERTRVSDLWGFKEPVTAKLLPLWKVIFHELSLEPVYLLCTRRPEGSVNSFGKAYGTPPEIAQMIWLSRYVDAVRYTDAHCEIFDYDGWFGDPTGYVVKLASVLGINESRFAEGFHDAVNNIAHSVIDPSIRTDTGQDAPPVIPECSELYSALIDFEAGRLSREGLIEQAQRAESRLDEVEFVTYSVDSVGSRLNSTLQYLAAAERSVAELSTKLEQVELRYSQLKLKMDDPVEYVLGRRKVPSVPHESNAVVAGVASFKAREEVFRQSITSVQDQFDHIYVFLNGYDRTPEFLAGDRFSVFHSRDYVDLSANGKVFALGEIGECFFFSLDDDILYPPDYVAQMRACLQKYENKIGVCVHGSILPPEPKWYYERYAVYPFQSELPTDRFVNLIGSGTFAFHTGTLRAEFRDFLPEVMVDLRFSILAKQQSVPLVSIARPRFWLRALVQGEGLYQEFYFTKTIHSEMSAAHSPWSFEIYADLVRRSLRRVLDTDPSEMERKRFDREFIDAVNHGGVPADWKETNLYLRKLDEYGFVSDPLGTYRKLQTEHARSRRSLGRVQKRLAGVEQRLEAKQRALERKQKALDRTSRRLNRAELKLGSKSYRLARLVATTLRGPIWRLVLLPYRAIKILAE